MPGSLYIAKHIWNIFPIQIKNIFIITSKSAGLSTHANARGWW